MKIIDAHIHFSDIKSFRDTGRDLSRVDYSSEGLRKEMEDGNVAFAVGMGVTEREEGFPDQFVQTPMGLDLERNLPAMVGVCAGINPFDLDQEALDRLETELQKAEVVGVKIYLGYYPFSASDDIYQSVYDLAAQYKIPVIFHTGDTYSERGLLKYSHPLTLDEVAVTRRDITFLMAHLGDPWVLTGAEVVYKNWNMYADLSGWLVGTKKELTARLVDNHFDHVRHALTYCDHYDKLLFGSDWPLVPIKDYAEFIGELIPSKHVEEVFYKNACHVFPKIKQL
ncbi:amidohydrolase family protein [Halobacillus karajensis]|uniref:Metal-dependent hydrolase of the TIM-barrel fold protein n=1 Tax=Halobacillus karajensis TaxID=195088 RepID=A0A024P594_9BACI|nr:amidohydrolase family protein [Halobacillus karajensis]CDQ20573.1 putative metal-dependent hydrolase of the TIM-barrel fold protein [Halobacillus karajensis]CDQ23958.1 putative metal-dependent hydrolase of the TIM-barrel fold protein [Halobacillus karajensis]CDQ27436.1 putative metal-dependent hydrolase of the TIM-barrel fold protein [Halobacillus karajensis]